MPEIADRPPYVEFYIKEVEDRAGSLAAGHYVAKDVAFVKVTRPGSKDTLEKNAEDWLRDLAEQGRQGRVPESWPRGFKERYEAWKRDETVPLNGTPIKGWPVLSPAAQQTVIRAGFLTVEDLSQAPDNELSTIGIGAVGFKQKAINWLKEASGPGKLVEQVSALQIKLEELQRTIDEQAQELAAHKAARSITEVMKK